MFKNLSLFQQYLETKLTERKTQWNIETHLKDTQKSEAHTKQFQQFSHWVQK